MKYLRSARGLKQTELAQELNVKTNTISNYENGVSEPDFKILDMMVRLFNINSFDLLFKDLASLPRSADSYIQKDKNTDILSEPLPVKDKTSPKDNCNQCSEKERIIKAQQITIDELRSDKAYLKEEIKELKRKLNLSDNQK